MTHANTTIPYILISKNRGNINVDSKNLPSILRKQ